MRADSADVTRLLKTARGQLDGLLKMVEDNRYCIDVSNQILATQAILKKVNSFVLKAHMQCCVREAFESDSSDEKIEELISLIDKMAK